MNESNFCECDPLKVGLRLVLKEYLRNKLRDKWKGNGEVLDLNELHLFYKSLGGGSLSSGDGGEDGDKQLAKYSQLRWMISNEDTLKFALEWAEERVNYNDGDGKVVEEDRGDPLKLGYHWESSLDKVGNLWLSMRLNGGILTREVIKWLVFGGDERNSEEVGEWRKCSDHSKYYKVS